LNKDNHISTTQKATLIILIISTFFDGIVRSLWQTQDIIAKKALHAFDWQLTILAMIWPVSNFFSIWWGKLLERTDNKSPYFIIVAICGRLILVTGLWVTGMNQFLILLAVMFSFNSLLIPAQNSIYQQNLNAEKRGKTFGYIISIATLIAMIASFAAGKILDYDESWFRYIIVAAGVAGFISSGILSFIKIKKGKGELQQTKQQLTFKDLAVTPMIRTFELLKRNREFARFQRNFTLYGMGFIMTVPVIPLFLVENLKLTYSTSFLAKAIISQLGLLFLSPFIGKLHDLWHPHRFTCISFAISGFECFFFVSFYFAPTQGIAIALVFLAYFIFGIAMAGVNLAWNMSSIYFAGKEDASMYQSVHVTMTGFRGLLAPLLGLIILRLFNIYAVFLTAALFLGTASLLSYFDYIRLLKEEQNRN